MRPERTAPAGLAKGAVWLGLAVVCWLLLAVGWMAFTLWPWPTTAVTGLLAGFVSGFVLGGRRADLELLYERKDIAVDTAMEVAFSAQELEQRISGEHPQVADPEPEDWVLHPPYAEDDGSESLPRILPGSYARRLS